jgi:octaprenyl-diphosphate synthase
VEQLYPPLREQLQAVEQEIERMADCDMSLLRTASRHVTSGKGKRLRPAVLLMCADACGHISPRAVVLAAVVELLHVASLVHDDVIDEAPKRRGQPSAHVRWGNKVSVLVGDYLLARAFLRASQEGDARVMEQLTGAATRMCVGQILEITAPGPDLTEQGYVDIVQNKTGSLFACAAASGAILAGASENHVEAIGRFGLNFGTAFQIADDLLDILGSEQATGKPVAGDLKQGKVTLPLIHVLQNGEPEARREVQEALLAGDRGSEKTAAIRRIVERAGGIAHARDVATHFLAESRASLSCLEDSPPKRALERTARTSFLLPTLA